MDRPINYGIVGLGRAGWGIHVHQLRGRPDARIAAVADPVAERRQQAVAEFGCKEYATLDDLLQQQDVEVVIVATRSVDHKSDTIKCLNAGRHVVLEKPMAMNLAEADEMIRVADESGRQIIVHQNYRFFPEFLELKRVVNSGLLGRIFHIRMSVLGFSRRNDWQTLAKNGGGLLNNAGSHFLDQILQLLPGRVTQVMGDLQQIASAGDVEDHVKALLRTDAGATADLEISTAQKVAITPPKWVIAGSTGTATLSADASTLTIHYFDPNAAPPLQVVDGAAPDRRYGNDDKLPWQEMVVTIEARQHGAFYDHVYEVVRGGVPSRVTPQTVREVIRVIGLIRQGTPFTLEATA